MGMMYLRSNFWTLAGAELRIGERFGRISSLMMGPSVAEAGAAAASGTAALASTRGIGPAGGASSTSLIGTGSEGAGVSAG